MICVNHLGRDPLPPGPLLFRRLIRDVLPASVVLPTRVAGDVSQAMRAWARWAAGRCDLPKRLRRRLLAERAGDPPEIAEQATRMAADGLDRDVIFDELIKDTSIRA